HRPLEPQLLSLDFNHMRPGKAGLTQEHIHPQLREALRRIVRAKVAAEPAHALHHGGEIHLGWGSCAPTAMADVPAIEAGARGEKEGFRRNATDDEAVPAQEIFLDQGYLRTETGGPCRRHQPGRPGTNDDQIVAGRRDGVLPIERMATRHEARVVYVRWLD